MDKIKVYISQCQDANDIELPKYETNQAAGMDLRAAVKEETTIMPGQILLVPTGIKIALPDGYEAQIRPRSGLAIKHGISMVNAPGTIDADYRGEIKLIMINFGKEAFKFKRGDRIAQMVINEIVQAKWELVDELDQTSRSSGGFGHTGNK